MGHPHRPPDSLGEARDPLRDKLKDDERRAALRKRISQFGPLAQSDFRQAVSNRADDDPPEPDDDERRQLTIERRGRQQASGVSEIRAGAAPSPHPPHCSL